ncbi:MAG: DUF4340 domain-containing protein [Gammaproteobacteria bacterium]|jgi:hypothetical protein
MSTRSLLNLVLAAAAVALGLVIYFQPGLEPDPVLQPLTTGLDPETVTTIRVERLMRPPLNFVRREGRWYLLSGDQELPASEFQIQSLLRLPGAASSISYPLDTLDPAAVGLEPPRATITIDAVEFRIGTTEPLENRRYTLVARTVYLIEDRYQHLINAGWANFVSRRLLPAGSPVTGLQLPGIGLKLSTAGKWDMTPADPGIGADAIQRLVENWEQASALYIRRFDDGETGEAVSIRTRANPEGIRLLILARSPELILARPDWGIQYHLSGTTGAGLLRAKDPAQRQGSGDAP